jgi:hypothetical protein
VYELRMRHTAFTDVADELCLQRGMPDDLAELHDASLGRDASLVFYRKERGGRKGQCHPPFLMERGWG